MTTRGHYLTFLLAMSACTNQAVEHAHDHSQQEMSSMLHLTSHDQLLANIETDTVKESLIAAESVVLGVVAVNEKNVKVVSSRLAGRLDRLYIRNPLQEIRKGDLLYSIYSEQLLTDEKSLLLVLAQKENKSFSSVDMDNMVRAAEKKLTLWGLSEAQLHKLKTTKQTSALVDFFSPSDGVVTDVSVREGEYVQTGTSIVKITDLHSVWVDAQLYVNEINFLERHPTVDIRFDSYPDKVFVAKVAYINPVVESQRKINLARLEVTNQGDLLKPGLMAYVRLKSDEHKALVIPKSSIILENDIASVWIQAGNGMYEKRMIKTGISDGIRLEVLSGLKKNDVVVSSGAYLLNSEFVLKNGANSMGGMKM